VLPPSFLQLPKTGHLLLFLWLSFSSYSFARHLSVSSVLMLSSPVSSPSVPIPCLFSFLRDHFPPVPYSLRLVCVSVTAKYCLDKRCMTCTTVLHENATKPSWIDAKLLSCSILISAIVIARWCSWCSNLMCSYNIVLCHSSWSSVCNHSSLLIPVVSFADKYCCVRGI